MWRRPATKCMLLEQRQEQDKNKNNKKTEKTIQHDLIKYDTIPSRHEASEGQPVSCHTLSQTEGHNNLNEFSLHIHCYDKEMATIKQEALQGPFSVLNMAHLLQYLL